VRCDRISCRPRAQLTYPGPHSLTWETRTGDGGVSRSKAFTSSHSTSPHCLPAPRTTPRPADSPYLLHELTGLESERAQLSSRVMSARVVDPRLQPRDEVRFGETVSLRSRVDEAAPSTVSSRSSRLSTAEHELISRPEGHRTRSIRSN